MHLRRCSNLFVCTFKFYFIYFIPCEQSLPINLKDGIFFLQVNVFCHSVGQVDIKRSGLCCSSPITVEHWRLAYRNIAFLLVSFENQWKSEELRLKLELYKCRCCCIKSTLISARCLQAIEWADAQWLAGKYLPPPCASSSAAS